MKTMIIRHKYEWSIASAFITSKDNGYEEHSYQKKIKMNISILKEQRRFNIGDDVLTGCEEWAKFGREELRYKSQQWKSVRLRERHLAGEENKENRHWLISRNQDFGPEWWWTYHFFHCCKFERHSLCLH